MAYSDKSGKIIVSSVGKAKVPIYATVVTGDLLTYDSVNYGFKLADQSGALVAQLVACADGVSGDTIDAAPVVVFETSATHSGGAFSATALALAADVGAPLYLGESGKAQGSAGATCGQQVGTILSTTRAMLAPQVSLSGSDLTLTGSLTVGTTAAITGATTITGQLNANGGVVVASGKNVTLTKGTLTNTEGNLVMTKGNITMTEGNITMTKGHFIDYVAAVSDDTEATIAGTYIVDTSVKDVKLTLPAAVAGLTVTAIATSATKQLTIAAATGDKILDDSYVAKDSVKANAGAGAMLTLRCLTTTNWIALGAGVGTWTYS